MRNTIILVSSAIALSACKPAATDDYVDRAQRVEAGEFASAPIESPDTEGAVWVDSDRPDRLIYGKPGATPLFALACETVEGQRMVHLTRFAIADPQATALIALVGNGHAAHLPIKAEWNERVWLWEGYYFAQSPALEVLTGPRRVEATLPGAGSVILNASQRPAELIEACRQSPADTAGPK
ncbi:hypothetical protein [Pontixanthobacter aquaemixtae]|uniref:Lipoprotein n=1 Tax=Pontixanthobacter aquaemixtae TaxID=1958940 RepID=A0A844ZZE8_9SPHN|nr:hypothetical protein [Pontixanthobacter aquaemixtae]MXO90809.1 hypothetical protein [Pontixanthobacter aquaemixtae]